MNKQAERFSQELDLATTLLIIWLLDKPLAGIVSQLKINDQDLAKSMKKNSNPIKRFLLLYIKILRKNASTITMQEQKEKIRSMIAEAKNMSLELEKRNINLSLPIDLTYLERIINV